MAADASGTESPECPGPYCSACNGEACWLCGAGITNRYGKPPCEHDVIERHKTPTNLQALIERDADGRAFRYGDG
jgi:hypothetical protein